MRQPVGLWFVDIVPLTRLIRPLGRCLHWEVCHFPNR